MQEVFEKIKERLEGRIIKHVVYQREIIQNKAYRDVIRIVNQVAEEYINSEIPNKSKDEFCKYESDFNYFSGKYKRETACGYTFYDLHHAEPFKFCPYCGKKIKDIKYGENEDE